MKSALYKWTIIIIIIIIIIVSFIGKIISEYIDIIVGTA